MTGDIVLGHPCHEAVLRTIDVPFKGADAIRKVIKSEVESAIHSHAVDDMVVDFHEIGGVESGSRVLVAAVPKQGLRANLVALDKVKIDPQRVDLDTMALYRVADFCGAFAASSEAADEAAGIGTQQSITAVLDVGSRSTGVLLVEGAKLLDMRSMRLGDSSLVDALVRGHSLPVDTARDAVRSSLDAHGDVQMEVAQHPVAAPESEGDPAVAASVPTTRKVYVTHAEVDRERSAFVQRLRRELVRFLASSGRGNNVQALWITGGACRLEGLAAMLEDVFGCAPKELDVFANLKHSLPAEEAQRLNPQLAVAVGLALANLGGPVGFDFRREDLAFTRGFDRVKFPLAIACMLALFASVVHGVRLLRQLENKHYQIGMTFSADPKKPQFYGYLNPVAVLGTLSDDLYFKFRDGNRQYGYKELIADLAACPVEDRIALVRNKLRKAVDVKQTESGIYEDVSLESGLAVLERFFDVLHKNEGLLGRYLMCSIDLQMKVTTPGRAECGRYVQCRFAFRGDDFRSRNASLRQIFEDECKNPGSPFQSVEASIGSDIPFKDGAEKGVTGSYYDFKVHVRESFDPFQVGQ
jgi:Tfp pilus assembly PilM family ATPase